MRQLLTIAWNAFTELMRQPVFLLLMTSSSVFSIFLACTPYFGFGEDPKLVKDSVLATLLLVGLFCAVISASSSVAHEIMSGTALAVLSKPVGRMVFLLGKYIGLALTLVVLTYVNLMSALIASKIAFTAYGDADKTALFLFTGAVALAFLIGGFSNYFLNRNFTSDTVAFVVILSTLAFFVVSQKARVDAMFEDHIDTDYRLIPAALLILCAFLLLAGIALVCSTRIGVIPSLTVCSLLFLLGLMSDFLFGRWAEPAWIAFPSHKSLQSAPFTPEQKKLLSSVIETVDLDDDKQMDASEIKSIRTEDLQLMREAGMDGRWWAKTIYAVVPNWQLFWLADALENEKVIPWSYVRRAYAYVFFYLGAIMSLAVMSFETRELN